MFAVITLIKLQDLPAEERVVTSSLWDLADVAGVHIQVGIYVDPLSTLMILVVSGVSALIHLYSVGYMKSDRGYARFFAYLNFFVFSMLLLVLAGNLVLLIVGWAFVGAASYMLISYWYRRTTATEAGIKAFVINVVGDVGLVLGTFFIFREMGVAGLTRRCSRACRRRSRKNDATLVAAMLLFLVGAFAKSAQIPLHTWLPDAMEGPTPVSALIHAATMVTAGVYLIGRMYPLFEWAPTAADVGAVVGALTLLIAGTIGLAVTDLKRVIAYSTMSQIGYMIMAVSAAALRRRLLPPDDARLLQGAAVHGRRLADRGDGRRAVARQDERLPQGDAVHVRLLRGRRPCAVGVPAVLGLRLQGRPARTRSASAAAGTTCCTSPATSARCSPSSTRGG